MKLRLIKVMILCLLMSPIMTLADQEKEDSDQGQQGPAGPKGDPGFNGQNGRDATTIDNNLRVVPILEFDLEHYDSKYLTISSFGNYQLDSDGNNFEVGMRMGLKLGKSYEEQEIEKLRKELKDSGVKVVE